MCHLLLGLPILALPVFWFWPLSIAAPTYSVVAAVSLVIYAYALNAMRWPRLNGGEGMLGANGRVLRVKENGATVFVRGELWSAEVLGETLAPGDEVTIIGFEGLKLRAQRRSKQV